MTADIIKFEIKQSKTTPHVEMPGDSRDLAAILSQVFINDSAALGFPFVLDYAEHVMAFTHPNYGRRVLLDIAVPGHAHGMFAIDANEYRLVKLLDRPMVHFQ